jgi:hypothetical protein
MNGYQITYFALLSFTTLVTLFACLCPKEKRPAVPVNMWKTLFATAVCIIFYGCAGFFDVWRWPQYILAGLFLYGAIRAAMTHGKTSRWENWHAYKLALSAIITAFLLYHGGFFSSM